MRFRKAPSRSTARREFQTRVTEMKVITRHDSPDTLILIRCRSCLAPPNTRKRRELRAGQQPAGGKA